MTSSLTPNSLEFKNIGVGLETLTIEPPATIGSSFSLTLPEDGGTANQFLLTDGSGVLSWALNDPEMVIFRDEKPSGTVSGTFTAGANQIRTLNTITYEKDSTGWFSLNSNQFTLTAGKYFISARAPAISVAFHKVMLYNVTDATIDILGSSATIAAAAGSQTDSNLTGVFTIADTKVFELRHRCSVTVNNFGFGFPNSFPDMVEVYAEVTIQKFA
jgi:hypothetical protein